MFRTPVFITISTFVQHLSPQNVIFPVKMTPIHKVWSCSLGGQRSGAGMFRTPVSIAIRIGFGSPSALEISLCGDGWVVAQ